MVNQQEGIATVAAKAKCFVPLLEYQREDVESSDRFRWNCWSRQTGKSFTKSLRRVLRGVLRRRNQVFLSAGERQSRELMAKARQHCQVLKIATELVDSDYFSGTSFKQLELRLPGGVKVIGLPANPQTARGFSGDLFLDEFAMHADDREIWAAMFPTLLRGDGELDVASTPKGIANTFARLRDNPEFGHSTVTLPDAVAQGLDVDIDQLRRSMGDEQLFRQEFLCEFIDESTAFLTHAQIGACEDAGLDRHTPVSVLAAEKEDLFVGVDIGRRHDLTVVWVLARRGDALVTRSVIEMRGETFRSQSQRIGEVLSLRNVRRCCIDAGGIGMQLAEAAQEDFGRHKVECVTFTAGLKTEMASRLRIAVEDRAIRIPADEAIRNDWHSLERRVSPSGRIVLDSSRREGHHADRFWAAALAVHAAADDPGAAESMTIRKLRYDRRGIW
ncbi:MAG TPA: terminase family protein [Phycisphaerae bacterium]|nr:terminase family protein [Phycisphaerae bacterium]